MKDSSKKGPRPVHIAKIFHEFRDPIHSFVQMDADERRIIDSRPFQRLRHIHQLALSYLVYPGASHKRFEHSLGVMELATRIYDRVTRPDTLTDQVREVLPEITDSKKVAYWRNVLRLAALCHDIGHLPFSHAAEDELLPLGWNHEKLSEEIILSQEMRDLWDNIIPPVKAEHIAKIAVGPRKADKKVFPRFSSWEAILSEIIVGDAFGADRMDYLLRDSHHIGVAYGRFDHSRLINTLRILTSPTENGGLSEPALGVEEGGIQSAEALLFARYFMFSQVYYHSVRRIYDIHLRDFLKEWLQDGRFATDIEHHLKMTDNEVMSAIRKASDNSQEKGHEVAKRIINRQHFRVLYRRNPEDININPDAGFQIYEAASEKFGVENLRHDRIPPKGGTHNFPVLMADGRVESSMQMSDALRNIPVAVFDFVFIAPDKLPEARRWLQQNREEIIQPRQEE